MKDEHDFFTPEQVDQQVEHFAPDNPVSHLSRSKLSERTSQAEEHLVGDLQGYYRDERTQDLASLKRAWQQVSVYLAGEQESSRPLDPLPVKILRSSHERTRMMHRHNSDTPKRGKLWRGLNTLAAVLVAVMLVGGMVAVFKMAHATSSAHKQDNTHTASASTPALRAVPSLPGLYLITQADASENSQVTKVDKDTGAVLWNHAIGVSESSTIVADNIVFGASGDQNAYGGVDAPNDHSYVYALNAKNGSQLWRTDLGADYITTSAGSSTPTIHATVTINGTVTTITPRSQTQGYNVGVLTAPTFANGVVYVTSGAGEVYSLNAANGAIIWKTNVHAMDYDTVAQEAQFVNPLAVANGVVYGATFNKLYALNAQNGHMLWSTSVKDGYSFGAPTVADGKVFLSLAPPSTHTSPNPNQSYIVAYSTDKGAQVWESNGYYWAGFINYAPVVANGLVYVANVYTGVYALDEQTGHTRWQHVLGTDAFTNDDGCSWPVVANGVVYTSCSSKTHSSLNAYNATDGNPLWSKLSSAHPDAVNGDVIYGTNYPGLVYFTKTADGTTTHQQTYGVLAPSKDGNPPWAPEPNLTLVP